MDRMIYLSMAGAKALMQRQDALTHNLANAGTDGFRADLMTARAVPVRQEGTATTRVYNVETTTGFDAAPGPARQTGNALDIAVRGSGWLAVIGEDGTEGYTRDGGLMVDDQGMLRTRRGLAVMGDGGPITIPQNGPFNDLSDCRHLASPGLPCRSQLQRRHERRRLLPPFRLRLQRQPW